MDIDKLIETLRQHVVLCVRAYGRYCSIFDEVITAISTLQAENEKLRAELEYEKEHANAYYEECGQWEAENEKLLSDLRRLQTERDTLLAANQHLLAEREQLTAERDAAITDLRKWSICITCIHYNPHGKKSNCKVKKAYLPGGNWAGCSKWKWRGPHKED